MKINDKMLSIPPYISTSWNAVSSLHIKGNLLVVSLVEGEVVHIPGLEREVLLDIFAAHALYLENDTHNQHSHVYQQPGMKLPFGRMPMLFGGMEEEGVNSFGGQDAVLKLNFGMGMGMGEQMGGMLQHNPQQAHAPDLPREVLNKFSSIAKIVAPNDPQSLPQAEPHCNCFHCQIARAIQKGTQDEENEEEFVENTVEENVSAEDLTFQPWLISQIGDNLYSVENKLDAFEKYNVFLGTPVGCTCGKQGCEHILAVLKS